MKQKQEIFTVLGGRVKFIRGQYNITSDAVFLASFVNAGAGSARPQILDVGIGTGGVSLCLLERAPDVQITGIDISESMIAGCAENSELNGRKIELIHADILKWRTSRTFDAVITNPPYFKGTARAGDMHHNADLDAWTRACLRRVRPHGCFYCIVDAAAAGEVIAALHVGKAGGIEIVPLFGGKKNTAERVLIRARLNSKTGTKIYTGVSMNDDDVLRGEKILTF
ncbi:MAG: methyltransferase domain-containing protein [Alphaproteobacteria bacterium]|nr:methyltransferase domain-containing protein [Alphaproteobacteria bacterium]MCL2890151.1 methyltransferase domain-containing protein [Alphaproteobacteria bacterium]